ncbi:MAG TPA: MBL fold metallo-hydrolase [Alphaproteobacteria bacterium]|nr:MBL fold metallo-hydrolase [Alphaproteobacteria bacterium]
MKLQVIGCGDAFGTAGRFNTCFRIEAGHGAALIDCGASSLIAMRRLGVEPNGIGHVFLTHLHGDHFAGLPFFILDAQLYSRRRDPLVVVGPPGTEERLRQAMEVLFPGSSRVERRFSIEVREIDAGAAHEIGGWRVWAFPAKHPSGAPSYSLRLEADGRSLAYTGDTEWTGALPELARDLDLLIAETLFFERKVPFHLDYATLREHLPELGARRLLLTHLGPEMFERLGDVEHPVAEDGLTLDI